MTTNLFNKSYNNSSSFSFSQFTPSTSTKLKEPFQFQFNDCPPTPKCNTFDGNKSQCLDSSSNRSVWFKNLKPLEEGGCIFSSWRPPPSHGISKKKLTLSVTNQTVDILPFGSINEEKTIALLLTNNLFNIFKNKNKVNFDLLFENANFHYSFNDENVIPLALMKMSDENLEKILISVRTDDKIVNFVFIKLLQNLLEETLHTKENIYNFVIDLSRRQKNKRLEITTRFITSVDKIEKEIFQDHFYSGKTDSIECFVMALHSFVTNDNNPIQTIKTAFELGESVANFAIAMVMASYGLDWISGGDKDKYINLYANKFTLTCNITPQASNN